jgi:hypothetical protein
VDDGKRGSGRTDGPNAADEPPARLARHARGPRGRVALEQVVACEAIESDLDEVRIGDLTDLAADVLKDLIVRARAITCLPHEARRAVESDHPVAALVIDDELALDLFTHQLCAPRARTTLILTHRPPRSLS